MTKENTSTPNTCESFCGQIFLAINFSSIVFVVFFSHSHSRECSSTEKTRMSTKYVCTSFSHTFFCDVFIYKNFLDRSLFLLVLENRRCLSLFYHLQSSHPPTNSRMVLCATDFEQTCYSSLKFCLSNIE